VSNASKSSSEMIDRTPKKRAPPLGYNLFVKEHSKAVREKLINAQKANGSVILESVNPRLGMTAHGCGGRRSRRQTRTNVSTRRREKSYSSFCNDSPIIIIVLYRTTHYVKVFQIISHETRPYGLGYFRRVAAIPCTTPQIAD
jgi:hypothetical protein